MIKNFKHILIALVGLFFLSSWGLTGHKAISKGAEKSFDPLMEQFHSWSEVITNHSGDADQRKSRDKSEGIKHYIDIDNYAEFITEGAISMNYDTLVALHGEPFVKKQGTLPWATFTTFDSLVSTLKEQHFDKAMLFAADLSHYVADGHMPLHLTYNYDGQYSDNKGIHSRYESKMINRYISQINIESGEIEFIEDLPEYVFNYIYSNYSYLDTILLADNYAKSINASSSSAEYTKALWEATKSTTDYLFSSASLALANLLYTAWITAGSPDFDEQTSIDHLPKNKFSIQSIYVNLNDSLITVLFEIDMTMKVRFEIFTIDGKKIYTTKTGKLAKGKHEQLIPLNHLPNGVYLINMKSGRNQISKRFVVGK
ncbi:MAG TPA: T9SS type A sorting domain-containing protein [Prolixibacteraceae bacterium]|nr:T9SS type A sorting domain-containing protein [Prolixibacteraceae bacterium]